MPSIFRRPRSPFFFCSFRAADGRWLKKSTKQKDRTKAMRVCMEWDKAAELARGGGLTAVQARKVLSEMVAVATGESLCQFSVEEWFGQWLSSKTGSTAPSTLSRYRQVTDDFLVSLGARAKNPLAGVTPGDVTQFRDALRKEGRAVSSVNVTVKKILSLPFEAARRMGYIPSNPVAGVDGLKDREEKRTGGRDPFTHDEVCRLVKACDAASDWRGAIILLMGCHKRSALRHNGPIREGWSVLASTKLGDFAHTDSRTVPLGQSPPSVAVIRAAASSILRSAKSTSWRPHWIP